MNRNYKFTMQYDGTRYKGWEHQPDTDLTIQGKLELVLSRMIYGEDWEPREFYMEGVGCLKKPASEDTGCLTKPAPEDAGQSSGRRPYGAATLGTSQQPIIEVLGCGRTDAGVHARGMVANAWLDTDRSPGQIKEYCNHYLPDDICILDVREAKERFHARYNAQGKTYRYTCYLGADKPVFMRKYVYVLPKDKLRKCGGLDLAAMKEAARILTGEHDFAGFCSNPRMKKSTVRTVDSITITKEGDFLHLTFHGTGFLQHMVRIMTGTLLEVGFKERSAASVAELIAAKDRKLSGFTAPAQGLCMMKVDY